MVTDFSVLPILVIHRGEGGGSGLLLRDLGGIPLFAHSLSALEAAFPERPVSIVTDDPDVVTWARIQGRSIREVPKLPEPASAVAALTVDPMDRADVMIVLDAKAPLTRPASLRDAAAALASDHRASRLIAARNELGEFLLPTESSDDRVVTEGQVRRALPHLQMFTTAALDRGVDLHDPGSRLVFDLAESEALAVESAVDFVRVQHALERGSVVFRLRANRLVGSGHLFHCLRLAEELFDHDLSFLLVDCDDFVEEALADRGLSFRVESSLPDDLAALRGRGPAVIVNDVLDTTEEVVIAERSAGFRVVNIEDLGSGARHADWVVNALYPYRAEGAAAANVASGGRYALLRNEFKHLPPKVTRNQPERALITFGGTDPGRLGKRFATVLSEATEVQVTVVCGPGSQDDDFPQACRVLRAPRSMAAEMMDADVVLTSAGRTVYEAAATGTPVVVIAQNAREATHAHLGYESGTIFLGLGALVTDDHVASVVRRVLEDYELRCELGQRLKASVDGLGAVRIAQKIQNIMRGL